MKAKLLKRTRRNRLELPHRAFRTATGNGSAILEGVDGRSTIARRYREIGAAIATDLGGEPELTEAQQQLIRSAAGLVVLREKLDVKSVNGEDVDIGEYTRISNSLTRLLSAIGLERAPRNITPSLTEYLGTRERG